MDLIKKYKLFIAAGFFMIILAMINPQMGRDAFNITGYSLKEMILIIPPIFILLGLLDVWVPKEIMMKYMGEGSGIKGIILAFILGSAAAGPLYGAFPIAAVFMKKGVKFSNILIFIGAWSTTKVPMFLFELSSLGARFAVTRLMVNIPIIIFSAYVLEKIVSKEKIEKIYSRAENM